MLLMYNYVLLKMSTWYSKHVEESNNIWRINNIQCITVVLYGHTLPYTARHEQHILTCNNYKQAYVGQTSCTLKLQYQEHTHYSSTAVRTSNVAHYRQSNVGHDFVVCHIYCCTLQWKLDESFSCVQSVMEFSTHILSHVCFGIIIITTTIR